MMTLVFIIARICHVSLGSLLLFYDYFKPYFKTVTTILK